jgi:hypothetical protein
MSCFRSAFLGSKNDGRYEVKRPSSVLIQVERLSKKNNYTIIVV